MYRYLVLYALRSRISTIIISGSGLPRILCKWFRASLPLAVTVADLRVQGRMRYNLLTRYVSRSEITNRHGVIISSAAYTSSPRGKITTRTLHNALLDLNAVTVGYF